MSDQPTAGSDGPDAPRLALRSPVEVLLWIILTRLMALVMPTRAGDRHPRPDDDHGADRDAVPSRPTSVDAARAARVAASQRNAPPVTAAATGVRDPSPTTSRTVAVTAATALAAGAAAFAAGRRRGTR